jgi:hypothetical protein
MCLFIPKLKSSAERRSALRNEKGREMEFTVTVPFLHKLRADQSSLCAISGVELKFCPGVVHMASLDRIIDKLGYTNENVRFVDTRFNVEAKWTVEKWVLFVGPDWQMNANALAAALPPTTTEVDGFTLMDKLGTIANNANERNKAKMASGETPPDGLLPITKKFLRAMWDNQGGRCAYSNWPMSWGSIKCTDWTVSIERLHKGWYTHNNIALIVAECNASEYRTERFSSTNLEPIGWNAAVVGDCRATRATQ